jgi:hypothetical protein
LCLGFFRRTSSSEDEIYLFEFFEDEKRDVGYADAEETRDVVYPEVEDLFGGVST